MIYIPTPLDRIECHVWPVEHVRVSKEKVCECSVVMRRVRFSAFRDELGTSSP